MLDRQTSDQKKIHDISPEISSSLAVWPGDQEFSRSLNVDFKSGGNIVLSSMQTTLHLGAHTDAPNHYHKDGLGIENRPLELYYGACQVITILKDRGTRIYPSDIQGISIVAERVLFRTLSFPNPNDWNNDFVSLSPELVHTLADHGVTLVGLDTPSIDLFDDRHLLSHQAVYQRNMAILEGVVLASINDGIYTLIALPLRLKDADASPVRAVLLEK